MNNRFMRLLVFFDLPVETSKNRRDYNKFHKYLIKNGFIMYQKSVYFKLVINNVTSQIVKNHLKLNLPPQGNISVLEVTENQFNSIEMMLGNFETSVINSTKKVIEID